MGGGDHHVWRTDVRRILHSVTLFTLVHWAFWTLRSVRQVIGEVSVPQPFPRGCGTMNRRCGWTIVHHMASELMKQEEGLLTGRWPITWTEQMFKSRFSLFEASKHVKAHIKDFKTPKIYACEIHTKLPSLSQGFTPHHWQYEFILPLALFVCTPLLSMLCESCMAHIQC